MDRVQRIGLTAVLLILAAGVEAFILAWDRWGWLALIYGIGGCAAGYAVLALFCTKCASRHDCLHVLPGRLIGPLASRHGAYNASELTAVAVLMLLLLAAPQWWIWSTLISGVLFWGLTVSGVILIKKGRLCLHCGNLLCPAHARYSDKTDAESRE